MKTLSFALFVVALMLMLCAAPAVATITPPPAILPSSNLLAPNYGTFTYHGCIIMDSASSPAIVGKWAVVPISPLIQSYINMNDSTTLGYELIKYTITATAITDSAPGPIERYPNGRYHRLPSVVLSLFYSGDPSIPVSGKGEQQPSAFGTSDSLLRQNPSAIKLAKTFAFMADTATDLADSVSIAKQTITITDTTTGTRSTTLFVSYKAKKITPYLCIRAIPTWTNFTKVSRMYVYYTISGVARHPLAKDETKQP